MNPTEIIGLAEVFPVSPEDIYNAWLDSDGHEAITGSAAKIAPRVNTRFSAWDGYISGKVLELEPHQRILMSWRTTEFPEDAEDSQLEIVLETIPEGTRLHLKHWNIPAGDGQKYYNGWQEYYFVPMHDHFG